MSVLMAVLPEYDGATTTALLSPLMAGMRADRNEEPRVPPREDWPKPENHETFHVFAVFGEKENASYLANLWR